MRFLVAWCLAIGLLAPTSGFAQDQNASQTPAKKKKREGGINPNEAGGARGGQTADHRLEITVHDEQSNPFPGAQVTLSPARGKALKGKTDEQGRWSTEGLSAGSYRVVVAADQKKRTRAITISSDVAVTSVTLILTTNRVK